MREHPSGDSCGKGAVAPRVLHSESWQLVPPHQNPLGVATARGDPNNRNCLKFRGCLHVQMTPAYTANTRIPIELNGVSPRRSEQSVHGQTARTIVNRSWARPMLSYLAYVYDFFPLDDVKYSNEVMNSSHTSALWTKGLRSIQETLLM